MTDQAAFIKISIGQEITIVFVFVSTVARRWSLQLAEAPATADLQLVSVATTGYQGRFKSFPVESDEHFLTVSRYVERSALTANLVERTQDWPWSSLWRRRQRDKDAARILTAWPVAIPTDWIRRVNRPMTKKEQESMQRCIKRGQPFGSDDWIRQTAEQLRLESTLRPPRRPRKSRGDNENDSRPFDLATDFSRHPDRIVQPSQYHREFKTS